MPIADWRGQGKTLQEELGEAFGKTGFPKEEFEVTKWVVKENGKSFPVERKHESGAEANIDFPHIHHGPDAPHVGWQIGGKTSSGGRISCHILLDDVLYTS